MPSFLQYIFSMRKYKIAVGFETHIDTTLLKFRDNRIDRQKLVDEILQIFDQLDEFVDANFYWGRRTILDFIYEAIVEYDLRETENALSELIGHRDDYTRSMSASCLINWGDVEKINVIEQCLCKGSRDFLGEIATRYYQPHLKIPLPDNQIDTLAIALKRSSDLNRMDIVSVIRQLNDKRFIPILIPLLADYQEPYHKWGSFPPICYQVAGILRDFKSPSPDLANALFKWQEHEFLRLKTRIINARDNEWIPLSLVESLDDKRLTPYLVEYALRTESISIQKSTLEIIIKSDGEYTVQYLVDFLKRWLNLPQPKSDEKPSTYDRYETFKLVVSELIERRVENVVGIIDTFLNDDTFPDKDDVIVNHCLIALRKIGTPHALDVYNHWWNENMH